MMIKHDIISISDVHLGSPMCHAKALLNFLKQIRVKILVLNGDMFEDLRKMFRLQHDHWLVLEQLRKMSDHCEVVWVKGNHDTLYSNKKNDILAISNLIGVKLKYGYTTTFNGKRISFIHGDRWDIYLYKFKTLAGIITWFYDRLKDLDSSVSRRFTKWVKKKSKMLMRNSQYVMAGALKYAETTGSSVIICGHTHHAMLEKAGDVIYGNDGTWESFDPTYIAISEKKISLMKFSNSKEKIIKEMSI